MRVLIGSSVPGQRRSIHLASLIFVLSLIACGSGPAPTATPKPGNTAPAVTSSPSIGQSQNKIARVFLQLIVLYQTQGLDVARNFALDQGLLTQQDEVRATLVLDSADPAIVESTAQSVGRLGGRVTQTYENRIEFVMPVQPLLEYGTKTNRTSFFHDLADFSHVKTIQRTVLVPGAQTATPSVQPSGTAKPTGGISEGVARTGADIWQAAGITGKGVRVGVIDNNFTNYRQFLSGARVTAKSFRSDGLIGDAEPNNETIHGAACAEIIREMAPDAELYLASVDTDGSYLNALSWLTNTARVSVISSSLGSYGNTPTNDTSYRSLAIDKAKRAGILFANSAGNEGSGEIGSSSGEGHFAATLSDTDGDSYHNFVGTKDANSIVFVVRRKQRVIIVLNWDDWKDPHVNYDLFLYDSAGKEVVRSDDDQAMGFDPVEIIFGTIPAGRYTMKVKKVNPTDADLPFNIFFHGGQLERITPQGSLTAPSDARGAVSVAAIDVKTDITEDFSSEGPTLDGRVKPDIGAPDSNTSYAYASVGSPDFPGTSAAAPHVAGAAALYKQAFPDSTPDMILQYFAAHAKKPNGTKAGENRTGIGLLFLDAPPPTARTAPIPSTVPTPIRAPGTPLPVPSGTARRSTVTVSPATASGAVVFTDDFASPTSGLPAPGYQNGTYHLQAEAGHLQRVVYPKAVADAPAESYRVDARWIRGGEDAAAGLLVRGADRDNYLVFVIMSAGQYSAYAKVDGSLRQIGVSGSSPKIHTSGTNTLAVQAAGTHFTFRVNGETLMEFDIPDAPPPGQFGFVVNGGATMNAEVAFAQYQVTLG